MDSKHAGVEMWVGYTLRYGVTLAAIVVLIGGVRYLHGASHQQLPDYVHFRSGATNVYTFGEIRSRALMGEPDAIIQVGLLLLILTPIIRVALCIVGFALEKNRLYVAVSCIVMTVLLYSLLYSR